MKKVKIDEKKLEKIALNILNDAVIFERMNKGLHYLKGAYNPENTFHDEDPDTRYNGYGIITDLLLRENEKEVLSDSLLDIFNKHIDQDFNLPTGARQTSIDLARHILIGMQRIIKKIRRYEAVNCTI